MRTPRHSHAAVALVLAIGVAGAILVLALSAGIAEAAKNRTLSSEAATLLSTTLGAAIGAVATYLGSGGRTAAPPADDETGDATEDPTLIERRG